MHIDLQPIKADSLSGKFEFIYFVIIIIIIGCCHFLSTNIYFLDIAIAACIRNAESRQQINNMFRSRIKSSGGIQRHQAAAYFLLHLWKSLSHLGFVS